MNRSSSSARGIGNPRQILRSRPSLRICHGLHPAPPPTAPSHPHTAAPLRAAALSSVARKCARSVPWVEPVSDFPLREDILDPVLYEPSAFPTGRPVRICFRLGPAPWPRFFRARKITRPPTGGRGRRAQTPRQRSCHGLRIAHDLPPTSLGLLYGVPRAERAVVASRLGREGSRP